MFKYEAEERQQAMNVSVLPKGHIVPHSMLAFLYFLRPMELLTWSDRETNIQCKGLLVGILRDSLNTQSNR